MNRIKDKHNYYLGIAENVLKRSTCIRRCFGAVIVKNDEIISTGYNGAPRGRINCCDSGICIRENLNIPKGQRYELCRSVHAEANAIISASRKYMINSTLYLVCKDYKADMIDGNVEPCSMCKRLIINAGIEKVVVKTDEHNHKEMLVEEWLYADDNTISNNTGY